MAIKFGPFCQACFEASYRFASDVSDGETPCIGCGGPEATVLVDPFDQDDDGWEPEVSEFADSEARWAELFGVVDA